MFPSREAAGRCFCGNMFFKRTESTCCEQLNFAAVSLSALNCAMRDGNYFARLRNKVRAGEREMGIICATWNADRKMLTAFE